MVCGETNSNPEADECRLKPEPLTCGGRGQLEGGAPTESVCSVPLPTCSFTPQISLKVKAPIIHLVFKKSFAFPSKSQSCSFSSAAEDGSHVHADQPV